MNPEAWAQEQAENIAKQMAPTHRAPARPSDRTARKAAEATAEKERRKRERTEKALVQQKGVADRMRVLPLPDVLDALGFQQDKAERDRWKAEGFNITLATGPKAGKWFDHLAQHGRGGAIDLVQHVTGADFKGALSWLADRFGEGATAADLTARMRAEAVRQVKEAKTEREPFTAPSLSRSIGRVRKYLVEERALPAPYIDKLHQQGDCYADARRNAVFICRDAEGRAVGAELKRHDPAQRRHPLQRHDARIGQGRRRIPHRQHRQGRSDLPRGIRHRRDLAGEAARDRRREELCDHLDRRHYAQPSRLAGRHRGQGETRLRLRQRQRRRQGG